MDKNYSKAANQKDFPFNLQPLSFEKANFGKYYSVETFDYHYDKHHMTYINNLNALLKNKSNFSSMSLEEIIVSSYNKDISVFNNAAQVWNHNFFWHSITPDGGGKPNTVIENLIIKSFGSFDNFADEFIGNALSQFGSGWVWLVLKDDKLSVIKTGNAENPISVDPTLYPVLTCDLWEHAYYIDYRNRRKDFVQLFLEKMVNWEFAVRQINSFKS